MRKLILLLAVSLFFPGLIPKTFASCSGALPAINSVTINGVVCTISTIDGVDKADNNEQSDVNTGVLTVTGGSSLTINSAGSLTIGQLNLANGSIAISTGGKIQIGKPLYIPDADGDGWASSVDILYDATSSGRRRLSLMRSVATTDCNDTADYQVNNVCCTVATRYQDGDGDGYGNPNVSISACPTAGYVDNSMDCHDTGTNANQVWVSTTCYVDVDNDNYTNGSKTCTNNATCGSATRASTGNSTTVTTYTAGNLQATVGGSSDCNDGNASTWQNLTGYDDMDGDGYGVSPARTVCSGASLPGGYAPNGSDCYDLNANAKPGSATCSTTNRGDGSYDYNCSGSGTACSTTYYNTVTDWFSNWNNTREECTDPIYVTRTSTAKACGQAGYARGVYDTRGSPYCQQLGYYALGASGTQACQ